MPLNNSQSERGFSPGPALQAVVVLYRCAPEDSPALCGLQSALHADPAAAIRVLVYDNSPAGNPPAPTLPDNIVYLHDPANGGLLAAYTHALQQAQASGAEWLLLLDQDTQVTADFVQLQLQMVDELAARPTISACVPRLRSAGQLVSPHGPLGLRQDALPAAFTGEAPLGTTAFNSGAMLRRSALQAVGGFPPGYWLDFLDHALFARLARAGFRLWVLPIELDHAMTWEDPARSMSIERFENVLEAERRFHKEYGSWTGSLTFRARCARRAWRYRKWPDKRYAKACWRMAL
jgi:cellulose synthase/poly-beta-1,6-N-acetylglucosamine synthase-like glycosyltransferase